MRHFLFASAAAGLLLFAGRAAADPATQPAATPVARTMDADARASFLAIEHIARLPADQQAEELTHLYRDLAPRYMNPFVEGILNSYPQDILSRDQSGPRGNKTTARWAGQLADAAARQSPEEVADRLGVGGLWLNVAARARALQVLSQHPDATAKLIDEDLKSRQAARVERAANTVLSLELHTFTDQLLALFLAGDEAAAPAGRALTYLNDPAVVPILLTAVEKNPTLLACCAGMLQGPLWRKPADPLLLKLLDSGDAEVRYHATRAVYECTDPKLAGPILRLAREDQSRFRYAAAYMAGNLPAESFAMVRDQLLPLLHDPDFGVRMNMMRSFAHRQDPSAGAVILDMLKRPQPAEGTKVTVMQSLAELVGNTLGYDMLAWGPGKPANDQAIRQLEAWLVSRTPAATQPATRAAADPATQPVAIRIDDLTPDAIGRTIRVYTINYSFNNGFNDGNGRIVAKPPDGFKTMPDGFMTMVHGWTAITSGVLKELRTDSLVLGSIPPGKTVEVSRAYIRRIEFVPGN